MKTIFQSYTATSTGGTPIILDHMANPFNVSLWVILTGTCTATFTVQETPDDPTLLMSPDSSSPPNWVDDANIAGSSATIVGNIMFPCAAVRIKVAAITPGTGKLIFAVIQAGV